MHTIWNIGIRVKIKLITDGDVSGALLVSDEKHNVDIFLGIGGGPEGVLAASALDAFGCFFPWSLGRWKKYQQNNLKE